MILVEISSIIFFFPNTPARRLSTFKNFAKNFNNKGLLKLLLEVKDVNKVTPLQAASHSTSIVKHLELIEDIFEGDKDVIRSLLIDENNDENKCCILYLSLKNGTFESQKVSFDFHKKYLSEAELTKKVQNAFRTVDQYENNLLHCSINHENFKEAKFYFICDIIKEYIHDSSAVRSIFTRKNIKGENPIMKIGKYINIDECLTYLGNEYIDNDTISVVSWRHY